MEKDKELMLNEQNTGVSTEVNYQRGFEEDDSEDLIIPRIKVVQDLSPERKEKIASEGDLVNSLTKEIVNGKAFVPVFKYMNNIKWKDRSLGGGIECISRDGKIGTESNGTCVNCAQCGLNKFDNSKQGKDATPLCTAYFNFFGFIEGEHIPVILSFTKTYYNEGKKMYSMAKFTMQDMWNRKYAVKTVKKSKNDNEWYALAVTAAGATSAEDKVYAEELYKMFRGAEFKADLEDNGTEVTDTNTMEVDESVAEEI